MAIGVTSYAKDRQHAFPFVTIPNFEVRAQKALNLSEAEAISWSPLVPAEQRAAWENYTTLEGPIWVRNQMDTRGLYDQEIPPIPEFIHDDKMVPMDGPVYTGDEPMSEMYAPGW